eukprot:CAMPEP_0119337382 /NCGR_PEP_ID=MMETSP1333-20130426/93899_1 /TAXON_ID=418940 /ORGANISM="Scyphosphaera apsteinii, Strain RCC1455" /LENGTH=144 /DNA_ID=CAMNT_0007348409 /DNA_START=42 /DNA_END=473 /DNA_ORIENTATION=+
MYGIGLHLWLLSSGVSGSNVGLVQMEALGKHHETVARHLHAFLGLQRMDDDTKYEPSSKPSHAAADNVPPLMEQLRTFFAPFRQYLVNLLNSRLGAEVNILASEGPFLPQIAASTPRPLSTQQFEPRLAPRDRSARTPEVRLDA